MEKMMTIKEANRLSVMHQVDKKLLSIKQASEELGISYRHMRRLRKQYVEHRDAVTTLDQQVGVMGAELAKLVDRASEVLGTYEECPTCGGDLDHVH